MKRREFFEKAGIGSAAVALPALAPAVKGSSAEHGQQEHGHEGRGDDVNGLLSSATVSFGQWDLTTPLDRFPNNSDRTRNNHTLIPNTAIIKAGGSVNFIISGFHHVLIYGDGKRPQDVNRTNTIAVTVPPGPPLINDADRRVYRGLDPSVFPPLPGTPPMTMQDRAETVRFSRRVYDRR
jgi:hypothetical protein